MIRFVYADQQAEYPKLFETMFQHRAVQFKDRLGWDVDVDERGFETDDYDDANPLYLIVEASDGTHLGSMRFLPTTGDTMINNHFTQLTGGVTIRSLFIWESTRFCLAPMAGRAVSSSILNATLKLGLHCHIKFFVGVFSKKMCRVYERIGWAPVVIGGGEVDGDEVLAGLWPVSEQIQVRAHSSHTFLQSIGEELEFNLNRASMAVNQVA